MMKSVLQTCVDTLMAMALVSITALAGDKGDGTMAEVDSHNLQDFAWLTGYWVGDGFGGTCEEFWSPPRAGSMAGVFKLSVDGNIRFYEIFALTIDSTGLPVLRLKHFNPDLAGWEEKDEPVVFALEKSDANEFTIGAVTYRKISVESLEVDVRVKDKSERERIETLTLTRVPL